MMAWKVSYYIALSVVTAACFRLGWLEGRDPGSRLLKGLIWGGGAFGAIVLIVSQITGYK